MLHALCRFNKRASWIGALFVCALCLSAPGQAQPLTDCAADHIDAWGQVEAVFDGDTIRLRDQHIIRLVAINAPELAHDGQPAQPLAEQARLALATLLPVGSRIGLRYDSERHDHYQRVLAHVFDSQGRNVSADLLQAGYAFAIAVPPNLWQSACYFQQEAKARAVSAGVWGQAYYQPRQAAQLHSHEGGFYRVSGRIDHIGFSRRSVWLDMGHGFAVRIPRKSLTYFAADAPSERWQGKQITVRGWARFYNQKLNMTLTHPAMLESAP